MQTPQNHDKHDRMVKRAVRIVPVRQRPHYTKIWSAELAHAGTTTERASVARAALEKPLGGYGSRISLRSYVVNMALAEQSCCGLCWQPV